MQKERRESAARENRERNDARRLGGAAEETQLGGNAAEENRGDAVPGWEPPRGTYQTDSPRTGPSRAASSAGKGGTRGKSGMPKTSMWATRGPGSGQRCERAMEGASSSSRPQV